jgi:hypothetical protein
MDSEVVEKYGGPYRGRTYGPLIKRTISPQTPTYISKQDTMETLDLS